MLDQQLLADKTTGDNGLVVLKGGKLIANGTADNQLFSQKNLKLQVLGEVLLFMVMLQL